ncbi:MAG: hypothetical protein OER88_03535 [Planctomycetota bacterium]|nr:hypothetical protein [Planctomycetota bacterium]
MTHIKRTVAAVALAAFGLLATGCGDSEQADHDHDQNHDHGVEEHKGADAPLSAADQKLADAQKVCPVSDEPLGSMGIPIKVMAGDRAVFLCCEGCLKSFEKNPQKYVEKLGN